MAEPKALIYQSELNFISNCVLEYPHLETGGDFFGSFTRDNKFKVEYVIGPGVDPKRTAYSFNQDIEYLRNCGNLLNSRFGLQHIGAWHSHHKLNLHYPSSGDINTMRNVISERLPCFLISICNINQDNTVSINPFLFVREDARDYINYEWDVLPGTSPFRERLSRENDNLFPSSNVELYQQSYASSRPNTLSSNGPTSKPEMPSSSVWLTAIGKRLMKEIYDSLRKKRGISNLEIVQKPDGVLAYRYNYNGAFCEMTLPHEFPIQPITIKSNDFNNTQIIEYPDNVSADIKSIVRYYEKRIKKMTF
jgi:hypothetical protein